MHLLKYVFLMGCMEVIIFLHFELVAQTVFSVNVLCKAELKYFEVVWK